MEEELSETQSFTYKHTLPNNMPISIKYEFMEDVFTKSPTVVEASTSASCSSVSAGCLATITKDASLLQKKEISSSLAIVGLALHDASEFIPASPVTMQEGSNILKDILHAFYTGCLALAKVKCDTFKTNYAQLAQNQLEIEAQAADSYESRFHFIHDKIQLFQSMENRDMFSKDSTE